jgi:uncharacterized protein (TIGR04255 family)
MATKPLPKYNNPPLDEVVLGATFEPLHRLKVPYIGLFWDRTRVYFPRCEQAPIIGNIDEIIDPQIGLPVPRVWLINSTDDQLMQIQKNKFFFNWRKRQGSYPHFDSLYSGFLENFTQWKGFIAEYDLGEISIRNYELTYFNSILQGEGWDNLDTIQSLFPDICWRDKADRFLHSANNLIWQMVFDFPDNYGNLVIKVHKAFRTLDKHPLLRLELTARGFNEDELQNGMKKWFDTAHEWIVRSFEDIADERVQREEWRKICQ